jgi:Flp pilus assembly protein TadD
MELCQRAGVSWAPPSARAAPARAVVRAEEVEAQAASLIEKQQWQAAIDALRKGEPLGPRGTNMLGRALLQLGDKEGARHAFERTLSSEPDNRIALRQLETLR